MLKINLSDAWKKPDDSPASRPGSAPVPEDIPAVPEEKELRDIPEDAGPSETGPAMIFEESPPPEEEPAAAARRAPAPVEKIPLSSRPDIPPVSAETEPVTGNGVPADADTGGVKKGSARVRIAMLAVILIAAAAVGVFTQKDRISGLFARKPAPVQHPAQKQPAPPAPAPEPAAPSDSTARSASVPAPSSREVPQKAAAADPALASLGRINGGAPARVWLTSVTVSSDGSYELQGMSFSHDAMKSFAANLKALGTVTSEAIPAVAAVPDTAYTFGVAGKLSGIKALGILEAIPPAQLAALGDSLKTTGKPAGVAFVRLPGANAAYGDADLPFEAEGAYGLIETMLGELTGKGRLAVHCIRVSPAASGRQLNRVRAEFSLRAVSSL